MAKTLAALLGKKENPEVEAVAEAFSSEVARIEQMCAQLSMTSLEFRREEWRAAEVILTAVKKRDHRGS